MDNGYTEGYATFWNGNAMTELTNGKLDVWTLQSLDEDYVPNWLQRKDHLTTDPQHPFLLIDTETDGPAESAGLVQNGECTGSTTTDGSSSMTSPARTPCMRRRSEKSDNTSPAVFVGADASIDPYGTTTKYNI